MGSGRAVPIAVSDGYLFVSNSVDNVKSMIDSSRYKSTSLAEVPEYALVAQGMYDLGAYGVIIADEALANGIPDTTEYRTGPRLRKFITVGIGPGQDEKGDFIALVLFHENPDNARENVSLLEQRIGTTFHRWPDTIWSFSDFIYDTEIHTEGKVLLAKLYTSTEPPWSILFLRSSSLVLHEE